MVTRINSWFANLRLHHTVLTWHIDHHHVGGPRPGLVGDCADVVTGVVLRDAAEEESLVQDVDIVICGLVQYSSLMVRVQLRMDGMNFILN